MLELFSFMLPHLAMYDVHSSVCMCTGAAAETKPRVVCCGLLSLHTAIPQSSDDGIRECARSRSLRR